MIKIDEKLPVRNVLIKIIAEYFYYLNLETHKVHTNILNKENHVVFFCERRTFVQFKL
jgi:hypothetical protein